MSVAKLGTEVETLRWSSKAARENTKVKGRKMRRASDDTAGSFIVGRSSKSKACKIKRRGKVGRSCLALMRPGAGVFRVFFRE